MSWVVVAHDFSASTQEAVGGSLSSKPARSIEQFLCYTKKPLRKEKKKKTYAQKGI